MDANDIQLVKLLALEALRLVSCSSSGNTVDSRPPRVPLPIDCQLVTRATLISHESVSYVISLHAPLLRINANNLMSSLLFRGPVYAPFRNKIGKLFQFHLVAVLFSCRNETYYAKCSFQVYPCNVNVYLLRALYVSSVHRHYVFTHNRYRCSVSIKRTGSPESNQSARRSVAA